MIRKYYEQTDFSRLNECLEKDLFQNVYLYIDAKTYGYENENVSTWIVENEGTIKGIIYEYYNSVQFFEAEELDDVEIQEICNHIKGSNFEMVSGKYEPLSKMMVYLEDMYKISQGCIMEGSECNQSMSTDSRWADVSECYEIAKLICSDDDIGGHYAVEQLANQLKDRMENWNCKNRIIIENGEIVSHMATYADAGIIAVLGGLVTDNRCRGKGYGRTVLNDLTQAIKNENKKPILYCYKKDLIEWYKTLGWKIVTNGGKLEKRR